ncbi:MAG: dipeptidase [Hymenobacteraceae bacterium]|nr:dipeptidase [Hymenobacteraceae bacterium]
MKKKKILSTGFAALAVALACGSAANAQSYKKLHDSALVVDTHNDVLINVMEGLDITKDLSGKTHSDLARFRQGGVDVQIFSVWSDETYGKGRGFAYANRQIDSLYAIAARNPDKLMIAKTPEDIQKAVKEKKLAAMIGVEGGHMMEDNLEYLDSLYQRGTSYMTLTWNNSTSWASSAKDEAEGTVPNTKKGLNDFGRQVVRRMNELGMMVDLSHVGEQTFWDAMQVTTKPVFVSHSCVHEFNSHHPTLTDDQITAVGKNGGVIHLNFFSGFLDEGFEKRQAQFLARHKAEVDSLREKNWSTGRIKDWLTSKYPEEAKNVRPPLSILLDHLDHIVKLVGVDHVGLGSDFDGITSTPRQLDSVADMPVITRELLNRGYSKQDIEKILGQNFMRMFKANQTSKI